MEPSDMEGQLYHVTYIKSKNKLDRVITLNRQAGRYTIGTKLPLYHLLGYYMCNNAVPLQNCDISINDNEAIR